MMSKAALNMYILSFLIGHPGIRLPWQGSFPDSGSGIEFFPMIAFATISKCEAPKAEINLPLIRVYRNQKAEFC